MDEPCRKFKQGRCNWGKDCRFNHAPEAAVHSTHAGQAQGQEAATDEEVPDYPEYENSTFSVNTGATATAIKAANKAVKSSGHVTEFKSELNASSKGSPVDSYGRPIIDDSNDGSFMGFKDGIFNFASSAFSKIQAPTILNLLLFPIWLLLSALTATSGIVGIAWSKVNTTTMSMLLILALLAYQQVDAFSFQFPQPATTSVSSIYLTKASLLCGQGSVRVVQRLWN